MLGTVAVSATCGGSGTGGDVCSDLGARELDRRTIVAPIPGRERTGGDEVAFGHVAVSRLNMGRNFHRVSMSSASGSDSATIPFPA